MKTITYSQNDRAIVAALKGSEGMTLAQLIEGGLDIKPAHMTSALKKGLIAVSGKVDVFRDSTRKVGTYNFVTSDVLTAENGKSFNYTEGELGVLKAASGIESPFTLADLAEAMGVERLSSGSINGLVKKGNISKGEQIEVPCKTKSSVNVYVFANDIPEDAE